MSYFSGLSFREKSAWISLGVILVVYIPYFIYISNLASAGVLTLSSAIGAFVGAVFFQIVLAIIAHIAVSIRDRTAQKDERDSAIESKAFRNAYLVLTFAICFAAAFIAMIGLARGSTTLTAMFSPSVAPQILLLCLVVAEATKYATQVVCYRRGI